MAIVPPNAVSRETTDNEKPDAAAPPRISPVSLTLNPQRLAKYAESLTVVDEHAAAALRAATGALESASTSATAMSDARAECASRDPRTRHMDKGQVTFGIDPALVPDLTNALNGSFASTARRFDQATAAIDVAASSLQTKIASALHDRKGESTSRVSLLADLRGYVRGMKDEGTRMGWLAARIGEGDLDAIHACVTSGAAGAYTSGISPKNQDILRADAAIKLAPKVVEGIVALGEVREHLLQSSERFYQHYASLVPTQSPARARSTEALQRLKKAS